MSCKRVHTYNYDDKIQNMKFQTSLTCLSHTYMYMHTQYTHIHRCTNRHKHIHSHTHTQMRTHTLTDRHACTHTHPSPERIHSKVDRDTKLQVLAGGVTVPQLQGDVFIPELEEGRTLTTLKRHQEIRL